jgi:phosphatidylglycerophosphate synthase
MLRSARLYRSALLLCRCMNLHTAHPDPDWKLVAAAKRNAWQRLAYATHGVVTPANALSVLGLLLVCWGAWRLYSGDRILGLGLVIAGRLADVADGYVAEVTGTKSRLGETVDVFCDKLALGVTLVALFAGRLAPWWFLALLTSCNLYLALFGLTAGRKYGLHPNRMAKIAMLAGWAALCCSVAIAALSGLVVNSTDLLLTGLYGWFFVGAVQAYRHDVHTIKR